MYTGAWEPFCASGGTPGGVKKFRLVFVSDGQAIYRANALATQAKPCALDEQTGLELAVLDHAEATRLDQLAVS